MIKNGRIVQVQARPEDYFNNPEPRGSVKHIMSASELKLFDVCPSRYVTGFQPKDSEAKDYGNLLDCRLLTPEQFEKRFIIRPQDYKDEKSGEMKPWNGNSNVCKSWLAAHKHMEVVSRADFDESSKALLRLEQDETITAFMAVSDRQVWVAGQWHDKDTGLIIPLKGMLDLVPAYDSEFCKSLADLKSTCNAALTPWRRWCYKARYHLQAALYTDLYCSARPNEDRRDFCFILSENYEPYQTGKRMMSEDFMTLGRTLYKKLLTAYCKCIKLNHWPDYDDHDEAVQSWTIVEPEPWMVSEEAFEPKYNFEPDDEPPMEDEERGDVIP